MELVSVIVPIYKVEPYLSECIESIISQTYSCLEIILVDDGSPDKCPDICDEFSRKDSRINVIHQKNGGLSDARNAGLRISKGNYYYFVDSDDRLPSYSIEWMLKCLHSFNVDMVIGGFERFRDITNEVFFRTCQTDKEIINIMTRDEVIRDFYRDGCQSWGVLYKRHIHEGIFFPCGEINEDEAIIFQILERCKMVAVTDKVVYSYRERKASITTSAFSIQKLAWYRHCKANLEWIRNHHPELTSYAAARYRSSITWSLTEIALSDGEYEEEVEELLKELRKNKDLFLNTPFKYKTDSYRMQILLHLPFRLYKYAIKIKRGLI